MSLTFPLPSVPVDVICTCCEGIDGVFFICGVWVFFVLWGLVVCFLFLRDADHKAEISAILV